MTMAMQPMLLGMIFTVSLFCAVIGCPQSCRDVLNSTGNSAASGEYRIWIPRSRNYVTVYCEMGLNGGGYTFVRSFDLPDLIDSDIQSLIKDARTFLIRVRLTDGSQPYGVLQQLPQYSSTPLKVYLNSYSGYTRPQNVNPLGSPYLFYGFLPARLAHAARTTQGFQVNGFNVSFVNCDGNPNSYIALYPNFRELKPTTYGNGSTFAFTDQFVENLMPVYSRRVMPTEYYMFMEMHQGGCGTYTQTDGRDGITGILSASIGFR